MFYWSYFHTHQVLFLGSGDLRNALLMASQCSAAYYKLDIHLSDSSDIITARNYLFIHVILSPDFDSSPGSADFQYLWDLWYSFQWSEATRKRCVNDVRKLLANQMTNSSVIPHGDQFNQKLQKVLRSWLNTACNMSPRVVRFATVFEFLTGDEICVTVSLKKLKSKKSRILNQI